MDQSRFIAKHVVNLPKSGISCFNPVEFDGIRNSTGIVSSN